MGILIKIVPEKSPQQSISKTIDFSVPFQFPRSPPLCCARASFWTFSRDYPQEKGGDSLDYESETLLCNDGQSFVSLLNVSGYGVRGEVVLPSGTVVELYVSIYIYFVYYILRILYVRTYMAFVCCGVCLEACFFSAPDSRFVVDAGVAARRR